MKTAKNFDGINIREVWDTRLSSVEPLIRNDLGETWVVQLYPKVKEGVLTEPLRTHDTGISTEPGDHHDAEKLRACYVWLHSVRDEYALPYIELRKPVVARINEANLKASLITNCISKEEAKSTPDLTLVDQWEGELKRHVKTSNAQIKNATRIMQAEISALNSGESL